MVLETMHLIHKQQEAQAEAEVVQVDQVLEDLEHLHKAQLEEMLMVVAAEEQAAAEVVQAA